jgi:hypothetical protein
MQVTISRGTSFSDLKKVRAIVDARAAADAVETLIHNSWTHSDVFLIEEAHEDYDEFERLRSVPVTCSPKSAQKVYMIFAFLRKGGHGKEEEYISI